MAETMSGLFGPSPYEVEQQRRTQMSNDAANFSQMNATQRGVMGMYKGAGMLAGAGAQAMGMVDPAVDNAKKTFAAAQGIDTSTPEGLMEFAQKIQAFAPEKAAEAVMRARKMKAEAAAAQLAQNKDDRAQQKLEEVDKQRMENDFELKKQQLSQAYDIAKMRSEDSRYGTDVQAEARREANAIKLQLGQLTKSVGSSVAQQRLDWQKDQADEKAKVKADAFAAKDVRAKALMAEGAKNVIGVVADAKKLVGLNTAGFGSILANLPATDARTLQSKLKTITANLGFDRLQQMRDASPTGGALGAVAVKELEALQSTVASLDQGLEGDELLKSLNAIEGHYTKWVEAVNQAKVQEQPPVQPAQPATPPPAQTNAFGGVTTPMQVKQLYQSGKINKAQAKAILADMESRGVK